MNPARTPSLLRHAKNGCLAATCVAAALFTASCASRSHTQTDAARGAAAGAVLGGVIGHQSDETAAGAAVGAAAGAIAGGAIGAHRDRAERSTSTSAYYSDSDYLALMTPDEIETLKARARASGRTDYELTDFLTEVEKQNLRLRATREREIGR